MVKLPGNLSFWLGNFHAEGRTNAKREARRFVSQHVGLESTILKIARGMNELCADGYEINTTKGEHDAGTD